VEAMAAGLAVAAPAVGDVRVIVSAENQPFLAPPGDEDGLASALETLAHDARLRKRVGNANLVRARAEFGEQAMIEAYRALYARAAGRPSLP